MHDMRQSAATDSMAHLPEAKREARLAPWARGRPDRPGKFKLARPAARVALKLAATPLGAGGPEQVLVLARPLITN